MEFLSQTYIALRGPTGAPQSPSETIVRLADRLSPATLLADRRAAVLALKGLSRDCKEEVGERALVGLVEVLQNDAEVDADIGKAVLETLNVLCEVDGELLTSQPQQHPHPHFKELGYKHTDLILSNEQVTHKLFSLLADPSFYLRLSILQFLITLLHNRRQVVQGYFLKSQDGPITVISVLEDKREIIRNEAITLIQSLVHQSPDIQKVLAFQGAFERLFNIINQEGGLEGGTVVTDVLTCIDLLLRFNSANQNYFRDTPLPPMLPALLLFPPGLPPNELAPQGFALQFWDSPHKAPNASLCVGIIGMLVGTKGGSQQESIAFSRCLVELALASNAPSSIKTQALRLLPANLVIPLPSLTVTPYMPVPDTNDEEWDRLEPASALDALVELVLHGEYNGLFAEKRSKDGLELRAAALGVFQNFVQREEIRCTILRMMLPAEGSTTPPPPTPLLSSLIAVPSSPLNIATVTSTHLSCLLFAHLLRASPRAKALARSIYPPSPSADTQDTSSFFVPADGGPPPSTQPVSPPEPEDEPQSLLQILNEHLSLAFLERKRADTSDREAREWDRLIVGYLTLLIQWLWEDPSAVKDFLEAGGLGMLVEPINEIADSEPVIPGLCSFLLGICYEYNLEPGEIKRTTIHPILTRLGVDLLVGRITHLRDDDRFKAVGPDSIVTSYPNQSTSTKDEEKEAEIWFDWAFVDFWKSSYYTIQKGLATDPNTVSTAAGQSVETAMLVSSLREVIQKQATEIEELQNKLKALPPPSAPPAADTVVRLSFYPMKHEEVEQSVKDMEKEQEDLLVLLDELNGKRKRDKQRMREAGMDVSEDEAEEEDEDE
ncbi:p115 like vesicle tethering protein [Abortiporus biennis]|nr:p115 like vesicle tethering protein [Abortiporus biennis]